MPTPPWSKRSLAVQAMGAVEPVTKAVVPPIHLATTFIRDEDNAYSSGFVYGRPDNATVRQAESVLAMLEDGPEALLFASGMAAATAVFQALDPGDHVVAPRVMYWALRSWLATEAKRWGLRVDFVETDDLAALEAAVRPGETKLVWIETPANPLWTITDIAAAAGIAHRAGARLAVDFDRRLAGAYAPAGARRRCRHACRDEDPERPFRRRRRRARHRAAGRVLGPRRHHPQGPGRDPRARSRPISSCAACARCICARRLKPRAHKARRAALGASERRPRALPGPAAAPGPRRRGAPDGRAASAPCCRSRSRAASAPRSRPPRG